MNPLFLSLFVALPSPPLIDVDGPQLIAEIGRSTEPLVVLNVWATWCGPCVRELPTFLKVEKKYPGKVRFMFVSVDFSAQREEAGKLIGGTGVQAPTYFRKGKDEPFIEALHPDWNGTLPATMIFDRAGKRLRFWQGELTEEDLVGALESLASGSRAAR
jgi:thiol-disulfide isomerase/thioredoxin